MLKGKNKILTCGIFGQMCVNSKGGNLGRNNDEINKKMVKHYSENLRRLKKILKSKKVKTPVDFAVMIEGKRKEMKLEEFPTKYIIYDIVKETQKKYIQEIR